MEMMDLLTTPETRKYKCYSLLEELLDKNEEFRNIICEGLIKGKVAGFDDNMWNAIRTQNNRSSVTFEYVFETGYNLGNCTGCSIQYSYSLPFPYICGGELPLLAGTPNSPDGRHTWLEHEGKIIDTTLMLVMEKDIAKKLGYIEENRRDPNLEPRYRATKDFINDKSLRGRSV